MIEKQPQKLNNQSKTSITTPMKYPTALGFWKTILGFGSKSALSSLSNPPPAQLTFPLLSNTFQKQFDQPSPMKDLEQLERPRQWRGF